MGCSSRTKERCADFIPNKVVLGAECALFHVLPYFENKICSRFVNQNNDVFGHTKFQLWESCSQGKALIKWGIFKAGYPTDADNMLVAFTEAI